MSKPTNKPSEANLFSLLGRYKGIIALLVTLTVAGSALNLAVPKIISYVIDNFQKPEFNLVGAEVMFALVAIGIFGFLYGQSLVQTYAAERVARDLRTQFAGHIATQEYATVQNLTPGKLLTNLTADMDSVKNFVSMAVSSLVSSLFLIVGASALLISIDWKLGLAVLAVLPFIGGTFFVIFTRVRKLFVKAQEAIDWLNKVINESILGAALIRLLNSQAAEYEKFLAANTNAKNVGLSILRLFATLIPIITFATNIAVLIIVTLGGHYVIVGDLSLGNFTAFMNYLTILIFPIFILGFMSNLIAQAGASYARIGAVMALPPKPTGGDRRVAPTGDIVVHDVTLSYGEKTVLKDISFTIRPGTKTAIIGPTAAGKSQLLYLLTGLMKPTAGTIKYDGHLFADFDPNEFHGKVGFVFQDSIIFNTSMRENIGFTTSATPAAIEKAIAAAELKDFIDALPEKLETVVSERGTSLSGGQKQRVMLARALALEPTVLLLDDFTARVDSNTEKKIIQNVSAMYPGLTLISVTQKIAPVEHYDQILVMMEGELVSMGTHEQLMHQSPEYVQIYNSQESTNEYEVQSS